jgi:uncharacterized protein YdaU (DUF1376 family)
VNYYERHLGDYARDTAHLSLLEHGVYTLLLDRYYATESPIPADQAHRVARARTRDEKAAVDAVLSEFFILADGLYRNRRADEEIAKLQAWLTSQRENGRKGGRPRKEKKPGPEETQKEHMGFERDNPNETQLKAHQTPDTRHQTNTPDSTQQAPKIPEGACAPAQPSVEPTERGRACLLMRAAGCSLTNPSHPDLIAALAEGVTPEALGHAAAEAVEGSKTKPFAWAISVARFRHAEGARPSPTGARHATNQPRESDADRAAKRAIEIAERTGLDLS